MVQLPKVHYVVKQTIFKQNLVPIRVQEMTNCVKEVLKQRWVRPYDHVKHESNFKSHGRR